LKVFPDTNVLAAAVATRGLCNELLESIMHDHELMTCQAVLTELKRVLSGKLRVPAPMVENYLGLLKSEAQIVESREMPVIPIKDADDIPILACAIHGGADVFVTGDKELLALRQFENLVIISPRQLWNQLAGVESPKNE
jgi:putative PIN family toxin of toxin-antitoxin system